MTAACSSAWSPTATPCLTSMCCYALWAPRSRNSWRSPARIGAPSRAALLARDAPASDPRLADELKAESEMAWLRREVRSGRRGWKTPQRAQLGHDRAHQIGRVG